MDPSWGSCGLDTNHTLVAACHSDTQMSGRICCMSWQILRSYIFWKETIASGVHQHAPAMRRW